MTMTVLSILQAYFGSAEVYSERWSRFRTRMPLEYTAPEQCYEDIYENTDVFGLGVIVYEAIFGRCVAKACFHITKTCPCNVYPLEPHFYIEKLGFAGVYLFFLFLLQNIDCGYSLEPPRRGGSNVYPQSMF